MEALQYIYTSWKNGDSTEKGYMIYSRSEGISEMECTAIKDAMQYLAPKELTLTPTPQEIEDIFPYAFSYFILPTGRGYIVKMLDAHIAMRKDYALYLRIYADTFLNKAISPSDYQYERNESLSDDELLYYNEIQEILKSINAQMSKHEIDHCKGIVI